MEFGSRAEVEPADGRARDIPGHGAAPTARVGKLATWYGKGFSVYSTPTRRAHAASYRKNESARTGKAVQKRVSRVPLVRWCRLSTLHSRYMHTCLLCGEAVVKVGAVNVLFTVDPVLSFVIRSRPVPETTHNTRDVYRSKGPLITQAVAAHEVTGDHMNLGLP